MEASTMQVRNSERNPHHRVGVTLLLLTLLATTAGAQTATPPKPTADPTAEQPSTNQEDKPSTATPATPTKPLTEKEARQAQIAADTDRLYQLAQELKAEVAKSNKDTLSLSVIKKATEVEKLAKSLKDRMKAE
jgi:sRNA-binding protein